MTSTTRSCARSARPPTMRGGGSSWRARWRWRRRARPAIAWRTRSPGLPPAARAEAARILTRSFARPAEIRHWLSGDDAALASGALRGLGGDLTPWADLLERHVRADDPAVVSAAIRPGLCVGLVAAWDACVEAATGPEPGVDDLVALATLGGAAEHAAVERALQLPGARRPALFALGFSGRRRAAELCLEIMDRRRRCDDATWPSARVAGEAFSAITGLAIEGAYARREPDDDDLDHGDEPAAARATPAEARLPLPDGPAIREWWSSAAPRFEPEQRYLGGAPISAAALVAAIAGGPMRRRPGHALELAVRTRGACLRRHRRLGQPAARRARRPGRCRASPTSPRSSAPVTDR